MTNTTHRTDDQPVACQNCDWRGDLREGEECAHIWERVGAGERLPYCDCPKCGAACFPPEPEPVLSACCREPIGFDAWVDSTGGIVGGPYDNSKCMGCGKENPETDKAGA